MYGDQYDNVAIIFAILKNKHITNTFNSIHHVPLAIKKDEKHLTCQANTTKH